MERNECIDKMVIFQNEIIERFMKFGLDINNAKNISADIVHITFISGVVKDEMKEIYEEGLD